MARTDTAESCDPVKRLAGAVILHAVRQARRGSGEALRWLLREAPLWLDALAVDDQKMTQWVLSLQARPKKKRSKDG
jgi:hypothetical protein